MPISRWLRRSAGYLRSDGMAAGVRQSADEFRRGATYRIASRLDPLVPGASIFDREWDLLVILDACRPDLLAEVADDYEFLPDTPETVWSEGSGSRSWMERNFSDDWRPEMRETAYVTGNPFSDEYVPAGAFAYLDEVWRYGWDDDLGTVCARPITDRAITVARRRDPARLLVHYMQPHFPSVPDPIGSGIDMESFGEEWESVWDDLAAGTVSTERVWRSYRANLEYVLEDVRLLLDSIDAETAVISSDHGNAFGEFGVYGHPPYNPLPSLRRVPWVVTNGSDTGAYDPADRTRETGSTDDVVASRLRDLGYR